MKLKTTTQLFPNLSKLDSRMELAESYKVCKTNFCVGNIQNYNIKLIYLITSKILLSVFILFSSLSTNLWGQANQYSVSISTGSSLEPVGSFSGAAIVSSGTDDAASLVQSLGFNFVFEGVTYTQFSASSNGLITLGSTAVTTELTNSLSSTTNKPKLMPLWDDISTGLTNGANIGGIYFITSGLSGSKICKIHFGMYNTSTGSNNSANTFFQVWLYETSNVIEFRYGSGVNVAGFTCGISGTTVSNYMVRTNDLAGINGAFGSSSGSTTLTVWPGSGTMYRFTPCSSLNGTYTINNTASTSGTNYASFGDAIRSLNSCGISGSVTFNVSAAQTFSENLPAITATGTSTNTITFQKSGVGANPKIVSSGSGTTDFGVCISGGDYITFDGVDVDCSAATTSTNAIEFGYLIRNGSATNGAQYNTIKNCSVTLNKNYISAATNACVFTSVSSTQGGVTPTAVTGANSYNKFYNLTLSNAQNGIYAVGHVTYPDLTCEFGVEGSGCQTTSHTISNIGGVFTGTAYGVYAQYQSGAKIFNFNVSNIRSYANNATAGILLINFAGTNEIYNNKISNISSTLTSSTGKASGIQLENSSGTPTARVYNNFIYDIKSSFTGTATTNRYALGIYCNNTSSATISEIDNNNIYLSVASGTPTYSSVCFEIANASTAIHKVRGNVFVNAFPAQVNAKHLCWYSTSATAIGGSGSVSNYNDLYVTSDVGTSGFVGLGNATYYNSLANWRTAYTQDANSISVDPLYTSSTDLHASASGLDNVSGFSTQAWVASDIDCETRSSFTPSDIGADAFSNNIPTLTLENATSAIAVSNICSSSTSVPIHAFNITGTNAGGTLTNFTFTTTGTYLSADVSNFKILYNTTNTTSGATTLATLSSPGAAGSKTFTAFSQAIGNATGYFWITMDVASGATNGGTITVSASASTDMTTTVTKAGSATASGTQTLKAAPTSSAGSAQSVCSTATLAATNPSIGTGVWSLVSGSGTITTSSAYNSGVTGLGVGANVFRWTVSNSPCTAATSDVTITLLATSTVFYSASTGDLNTLSNWWSNTDGSTGCNPLNFTTANTTYYITNRTTATIGAAWTVSGASSKVVLGQATAAAVIFTIPNNYAFTGTIDIAAASSGSNTLVINNTSIPTFGTLNAASTVKYNAANSQTISVATYGNLETGVESGTSNYTKTVAGILDINGNLTIGDYTTLNLSTYSHTLAGHMIKASSNSTFTAIAGTITFDGTSIQHINVVDPTAATITPCDADISFGNIIINGSNVCLWYNKTSDKKINIIDFTVNTGKSAKFYSGPAVP